MMHVHLPEIVVKLVQVFVPLVNMNFSSISSIYLPVVFSCLDLDNWFQDNSLKQQSIRAGYHGGSIFFSKDPFHGLLVKCLAPVATSVENILCLTW